MDQEMQVRISTEASKGHLLGIEATQKSSVKILGIRIDLVDCETTIALMKECIVQRTLGQYICACPVHPIMLAQTDRKLRKALENSWLTVPDGMPVVWAARLLGAPIKNRVYGPTLMLHSCEMAERLGYSIFLYGGKPQALKKLRVNLLKLFPRLRIAGIYSPPFRILSPEEERKIIEMINGASPDILVVGLGAPKQEKWMAKHFGRLKVPVTLGVGAAFDFLSGEKKQAPAWMQVNGLEWLFRLLNEPTRLWARYIIYNPLFVFLFLGQLIGERLHVSGKKHVWTRFP